MVEVEVKIFSDKFSYTFPKIDPTIISIEYPLKKEEKVDKRLYPNIFEDTTSYLYVILHVFSWFESKIKDKTLSKIKIFVSNAFLNSQLSDWYKKIVQDEKVKYKEKIIQNYHLLKKIFEEIDKTNLHSKVEFIIDLGKFKEKE